MLTKNKRKKTINTAIISSHVCLKNRVSDFWNVRSFYFYKKIYSGMRNYYHHWWKIGYNFETLSLEVRSAAASQLNVVFPFFGFGF